MNKPEVLAPAGNAQSLIAAVRTGADAVYLGATSFSARRNADNFDAPALKAAAQYCRIRGVKLYLTLNIMVKNEEIEEALALAGYANEIGVDGLIMADIGLAAAVCKRYPDLPVHASTQMTVHDVNALPLLKKIGIKRVVLAREMTGEQIAAFTAAAKKYGIQTEVFVHGALCMCVSGQCLLSSVLGSRSGNRGLCAGPCRLPFAAPGGTGYDLSLKDLSLSDKITELARAGVASLKIEGRMKRPEYVAAATTAIRQAVDTGHTQSYTANLLKNVFSRSGFTDGYYTGRTGREMFGIRTKDDVLSAPAAIKSLHGLYRAERQVIPLDMTLNVKKNAPVTLSVSDGAQSVFVSGEAPRAAQTAGADDASLKAVLAKLGGTPYFARTLKVNVQEGLFVPVSALNALRRAAIEKMDKERSAPPPRRIVNCTYTINNVPHNTHKLIARFYNTSCIPRDLSALYGIVLPCESDFTGLPENLIKIADTPRYIKNSGALLARLKALKGQGVTHALCGNISGIEIARAAGLEVIGDAGLNIANDLSANLYAQNGMGAAVLSCELTLSGAEKIQTTLKKGIFAYGRLPLMLTVNCPLKNGRKCSDCGRKGALRDRTGAVFPVRCRAGYSELFNSAPVYLADKPEDIKGVDFLLLSFTDETKEKAEHIINAYKNGAAAPERFTRGLYYKGVK